MVGGAENKSNNILNYPLFIFSYQKVNLIKSSEALSWILVEWNGW